MKCPACDIEMELLIDGIFQCPNCKKIIKAKSIEAEKMEKKPTKEGVFQDGEFFHKNVSLNKQYEICEFMICDYLLTNIDIFP